MKGHFHTLDGGGISEDKRMINAKSPWTLAHLDLKVLRGFYKNPAVPPSMKKKLKDAMMMKPTLKGGMSFDDSDSDSSSSDDSLTGGLAGVSKASGFIQRLMAENKLKHSGQYKKPTAPAHPDSTMNKFAKFDYKQIANKDQGGESEANNYKYGASPFIQKYFKNSTVPFTRGNTAKETEAQKAQRKVMETRRRPAPAPAPAPQAPPAPAPAPAPQELKEHFGNQTASNKEGRVIKIKKRVEMTGSSHYKLVKPAYFSNSVCSTGIEELGKARKWIEGLLKDNLYVAQFHLEPSYHQFIEGTTMRGYGSEEVFFIPNFDKYTDALSKMLPLFRKFKILPSFYVKFLTDLKERLREWMKIWEDSYDSLVLPVLEQLWGKNKSYPLYMDQIVSSAIKYPSEESKEFWKKTQTLDIRIVGSITLQSVLFITNWEKDFKQKCKKAQEDGLDSIESLLKAMEGLDNKDKRKARNEAILGWIDFHIAWRKEYLRTKVYPEGLEIPYTPDEVGWILRNPNDWDMTYGDYEKWPPYTQN